MRKTFVGSDHLCSVMTNPAHYLWSDVWFLLALSACESERATLGCVIAVGDSIQHAIMTREEVNGALGRLGRGGYVVRCADGTLELTDVGRSLVAGTAGGPGWRARQQYLEHALSAAPWTSEYDPRRAADGEVAQIKDTEYAEAVARYNSPRVP